MNPIWYPPSVYWELYARCAVLRSEACTVAKWRCTTMKIVQSGKSVFLRIETEPAIVDCVAFPHSFSEMDLAYLKWGCYHFCQGFRTKRIKHSTSFRCIWDLSSCQDTTIICWIHIILSWKSGSIKQTGKSMERKCYRVQRSKNAFSFSKAGSICWTFC